MKCGCHKRRKRYGGKRRRYGGAITRSMSKGTTRPAYSIATRLNRRKILSKTASSACSNHGKNLYNCRFR